MSEKWPACQARTQDISFEWAFVTVKHKSKDFADGDAGVAGHPGDKCTCNYCGKTFATLLPRVRAHIAGVKGFDVK